MNDTLRKLSAWLLGEWLKVLPAAVFFTVTFSLIAVNERLVLQQLGIEVLIVVRPVIGALVVAKVLLIVNLFPFVNRYPNHPLVYNTVWKTTIYMIASLVYRYLEGFGSALYKSGSVAEASRGVLEEFALPRFWAVEIWLAALFLVFVAGQELVRVLGHREVRRIFFGR